LLIVLLYDGESGDDGGSNFHFPVSKGRPFALNGLRWATSAG